MNVPEFRRHLLPASIGAAVFAVSLSHAIAQQAVERTDALRGLDAPTRVEGEYVVVLKDDSVGKYMSERRETDLERAARDISQDFAFRYGGRIDSSYGHALKGFAVSGIDERTAKAISADPGVAFVEANKVYAQEAVQSPATWGLDRIDQRSLPLGNSYSYVYTGLGVRAYIIDSGIRAHNEFGSRLQSTGFTAVSDGNGISDCVSNGHGTHVAGTVGGSTYGVAKAVTLYSVRVFDCSGHATSAQIVSGVNWVAANAVAPAVVNMSAIGPIDTAVESAVSTLLSHNITVVTAAGNDFSDSCQYTPARMAQTTNVINVANSTKTDARNALSNWGRCVTLFAPGTDITSAGVASTTATAVMTGTSMSSPHVAGAAALYLESNSTATPAAVKTAIVYASTRGAVSNTGSSPNRLLYTGFGQSGGSDPAYTPAPPAPIDLNAFCKKNGGLWRLTWSSSGDVGGIQIYKGSVLAGTSSSYYLDVGVGTSGSSTWSVRACNGAGCSGFSDSVTINASPLCP